MNTYKQSYDGKTKREHRIVMEKKLGRPLKKDEIVHHIDGNKRNNDSSNLLLTTRSEHAKIHKKDIDKSIPVVQMSKDFQVIKVWESARKAALALNIYNSNICHCCKGKLQTTGGYRWKYAEQR